MEAICKLKSPKGPKDVRTFLESVRYLMKHTSNILEKIAPILELLNKGKTRPWEEKHQNTFIEIKSYLENPENPAYLSPGHESVIKCDTSISWLDYKK